MVLTGSNQTKEQASYDGKEICRFRAQVLRPDDRIYPANSRYNVLEIGAPDHRHFQVQVGTNPRGSSAVAMSRRIAVLKRHLRQEATGALNPAGSGESNFT